MTRGSLVAVKMALLGALFCQRLLAEPDANVINIVSNAETYDLTVQLPPGEPSAQDLMSIRINVSEHRTGVPSSGPPLIVTVDATMPGHYHGLTRRPKVLSRGLNEYVINGLFFHMPGKWDVFIDIKRGIVLERAQFSIDVK